MNLDDLTVFQMLDSAQMIIQINRLPQQLEEAWMLGQSLPLPVFQPVKAILLAGMGGSAIGADLLAAYAAGACPLPVFIHRDYDLPAWASGPEVLVIAISHSGDTEETLSAFDQAQARGCQTLILTTGGKLAEKGRAQGAPVWQFDHAGQPRTAVGYIFGLLLALFCRMGWLPDATHEVQNAVQAMREQQKLLLPEVAVTSNPAKRMAGQMMNRWVMVFASDYLDPVARRWKDQINELAKAVAQFEGLPEADHNTLAGIVNPENHLMQTIALFLEAPDQHPRNHLRLEYTRQILMTQGINTDRIQAKGEGRLAHLWTLLHFGDYTSYYLAMAYGENPSPVDFITSLKEELGKISS